jgi:hypothetical protein
MQRRKVWAQSFRPSSTEVNFPLSLKGSNIAIRDKCTTSVSAHTIKFLKGVVPRPLGHGQFALPGALIHGVQGSIDLELMKRKSFLQIKNALPRSWFLATAKGFKFKSIIICTLTMLL